MGVCKWTPPPTYILPNTCSRPCNIASETAGGCYSIGIENGWVDRDIFLEWLKTVVVKKTGCSPSDPFLLFTDGHSSRYSLATMAKARAKGIIIYVIPGPTWHASKFLEAACRVMMLFSTFKLNKRKRKGKQMALARGSSLTLGRDMRFFFDEFNIRFKEAQVEWTAWKKVIVPRAPRRTYTRRTDTTSTLTPATSVPQATSKPTTSMPFLPVTTK